MPRRTSPELTGHAASAGIARRRRRRLTLEACGPEPSIDSVVIEEPLEMRVEEDPVAITMRTPGDDESLVLGFLFAEGLIRSAADVTSVFHCGRPGEEGYGNVVDVRVRPGLPLPDWTLVARHWTRNASCGVCGRRSIDDLLRRCAPVPASPPVDARVLLACMDALRATQRNFATTGGLHAAGIFDACARPLACFEDIGRHNAVDKAIGLLVRLGLVGEGLGPAPRPALLLVSGRASFEIVQKAAAASIPIVASVSAASSLAIDLADATGITLAAFVRGQGFSIYSHPERIVPGRGEGECDGEVPDHRGDRPVAAPAPAQEP